MNIVRLLKDLFEIGVKVSVLHQTTAAPCLRLKQEKPLSEMSSQDQEQFKLKREDLIKNKPHTIDYLEKGGRCLSCQNHRPTSKGIFCAKPNSGIGWDGVGVNYLVLPETRGIGCHQYQANYDCRRYEEESRG